MKTCIQNALVFVCAFLLGAVAGAMLPPIYGIIVGLAVSFVISYLGLFFVFYGPKQMLVELIYTFWPVMPWSWRYWALFRDNTL